VLNYVHKGGTNPALNVRNTTKGFPTLPETGSSLDFDTFDINGTIPDGSVANPGSWGHTGIDLFNKTCVALGSLSGNDNGVEVRLVGKANDHPRIINFKTDFFGFLRHFRYGDLPQQTELLTQGTDFTLLDNHTAFLPGGSVSLYGGLGDIAMTDILMFNSSQHRWNIRGGGGTWQVDSYHPRDASRNTYHQIWVRAEKS
jgi:hypothetical protein